MIRLAGVAENVMKDILSFTFSKNGPLGGVRFDIVDDKFDLQPAVSMLPKPLVVPFETIIGVLTTGLSDANKDSMIGVLADVCAERLEKFIYQVCGFLASSDETRTHFASQAR